MPSFGSMLSLTAKPSSFAITCVRFRSRAPYPFGPRNLPFLSRKSRLAFLPCAASAHLAACLDVPGKILRTDLCNRPYLRAPENRSNPGVSIPGGSAFDDALQLRTNCTPLSFVTKRELSSSAFCRSFPASAFSAVARAGVSSSDPSATPCSHPFYEVISACQAHFHHPRVNENGFSEPRCLPSTSAPVREPATVPIALPRQAGFRRFCCP